MQTRDRLFQILCDYFDIKDTYAYNLTRDKSAFSIGTMSLDDFVEFDEDIIHDIVSYLIRCGVTVKEGD